MLFLTLSVISLVLIFICVYFFHLGLRNYWFVFISIALGGLPIILLLRELECLISNSFSFFRLLLKWPFVVWVMGTILSIIYVLAASIKGL